jgi:hypothetical protein
MKMHVFAGDGVSLKEFLKPSWRNITIFAIFSILSSLYVYNCYPPFSSGICEAHGFPLAYWSYSTRSKMPPIMDTNFSYLGLIGDLVIWYLTSCLIIWIYHQLKKEPKTKSKKKK